MAKYGLCDRCKEPSILGQVPCEEDKPWLCPECACEFFNLPIERAEDVKKSLLEQLEKSGKADDDSSTGA